MVHQRNISIKKKEVQDDLPSVKGNFWWTTLGKHHIPYLKKSDGTKYVSVRMAEMKVLNFFLTYLDFDVRSCYSIKSFEMTEAEANLLNAINVRHSESMFGHEEFTVNNDFIVKLSDLIEFHRFVETCYNKLLLKTSNKDDRCGFIRINNESVVPYTLKDDQKYIPLFYFDGETDTLKETAKQLDSWDLAYLKFCFLVQGIKNELFASETCLVMSLDDIKSYFPDGTTFDDFWPNKVNHDMQIPQKNYSNSHPWVRAPFCHRRYCC